MKKGKSRIAILVTLIAVLIGAVVIIPAISSGSATPTMYGCVHGNPPQLRTSSAYLPQLNTPVKCASGDTQISWQVNTASGTTTTTTVPPTTSTTVKPTTTTTTPGSTSTTTTTVPTGNAPCAKWPASGFSAYSPSQIALELNNDVFSPEPGFAEDICGNAPFAQFHTDVNASNCGGCIQAYPSAKYHFDQHSYLGCCGDNIAGTSIPAGDIPVNSISSIPVTFSGIGLPSNTNAEFGYDLAFANNCGTRSGGFADLMIWPDTTASRGTGGAQIYNAHANIGGQDTTYMVYGGEPGGEPIVRWNTNATSGSFDLMDYIRFFVSTGDLKPCDSKGLYLDTYDYGFEVAQTNGTQTFSVGNATMSIITTDGVTHS